MVYLGEVGDVTETRRNASIVSLEWRIPEFLSIAYTDVKNTNFKSPGFIFCNSMFYFHLFLSKRTFDLMLSRSDVGAHETIKFTVGFKSKNGVTYKRKKMHQFCRKGFDTCLEFFGSLEWENYSSAMMNENALIIMLEMEADMSRDKSTQTIEEEREGEVPTEENQSSEKQDTSTQTIEEKREVPNEERRQFYETQGMEQVMEDIGKVLVSGENSDVTVQVGDKEFKVHQVILSARCPVLSSMLKHETAEKASGRITVHDCDPDIFGDFLHYLYQGSVQRLSEKNVFDLYRVADQYLADNLKQQCLVQVQDKLSVQTFCDTVRLALTHGLSGLLEQVMDFASSNIRSIIRSVEWQKFLHDCPTEANELLIKALGPENENSKR